MADDAFQWHPNANLWVDGAPTSLPTSLPKLQRPNQAIIAPRPGAKAITAVFAMAQSGGGFAVTDQKTSLPDPTFNQFYCLTGGSTGAPKLIARSMESWIASFKNNAAVFAITTQDHYGCLGGLEHSLNLYAATEALHLGADLSLLSCLRPDAQTAEIQARNITVLYATPTHLHVLLKAAKRKSVTFEKLRYLFIGGAALAESTMNLARALCPNAQVIIFYGAAETSFITMADRGAPNGSVGRAYGDVQLEIRTNDGARCAAGQIGTIWLQSPYVFEGYALGANPHLSRKDNWLSLGERGALDAQGYLTLHGRSERAFQIAAETIFPEPMEAYLCNQTGIKNAAVFARPDPLRGAVAVAVIQGQSDDPAQLLAKMRHKFGPLAAPRQIIQCEDWPLLPSGKTNYTALQEELP